MRPAAEYLIDRNSPDTAVLCRHSARQKRNRFVALAVWILLLASACLIPARSTHVGSADAHGTIEWVGALFALVVGLAMITRFYALGNRMHLFIGLAFFVNGMEDFVHGLLSLAGEYEWLGVGHVALARFIPGTYVTGRLLFGALLVLAPFTLRLFGASRNPKRETIRTSAIVLLATAAATAAAFILPLPRFIHPQSIIPRPADFVSAVVLLAALTVFIREYHRHSDAICWWVLLSISINLVGQVQVSFSRSLFDPFFDSAHVYKVIGYAVPLLGFCLYQVKVITERKRAEDKLAEYQEHLEELVETRTRQLENGNKALQQEIAERREAQATLRASEERLRITLTGIGDGVIATDTNRRITRLNRMAEELTGWTAAEAQGRPLEEVFRIINEETREPATDPVARVLASGRVEGLANHTVLITRSGAELAIADSAAPIREASGRIVGVVLVFRDVSAERQHQKERDRLLHDLNERVKELGCLYGLSKIVERPKITLEQIFRETIRLLPSSWRHPEIACGRIRFEGQVFETCNRSEHTCSQSADILVYGRKQGSLEVCYREARPAADEGPFLKEERALIDAVAERLGKIAERKQAEEALRKSETKHRTLLENLPQRIFAKDRDLVYISCNDNFARALGIRPEEFPGKTDYDFFPKELAEKYRADDKRVMESGQAETIEEVFIENARETIVQTVKTPIKNEKGDPIGILGIFWDITDRKRAEEELKEAKQAAEAADRAKSRFLANTSHEIRTPLTAILGYTDLLTDPELSPSDRDNHLAVIGRNGRHLLELINDILDLSKIEAGKLPIETAPCSLVSLLADLASMMRVRAEQRGISLSTDYTGQLPETILTDGARLRQALVNLVGNAVKFTERGGVRIVAAFLPDWRDDRPAVRIRVIDTGIGIGAEQLPHVFDPFVQADASTSRKAGGTGLGLTITNYIAELLDGELTVESTPGEGSTFTL